MTGIRDRMTALLEREPFPVGTRRQWQNGEHIKLPDGTWAEVSKNAPPPGTNQNYIGTLTPDGKRWSLEGFVPPKAGKPVEPLESEGLKNRLLDCLNAADGPPRAENATWEAEVRKRVRMITESGFGMVSRDVKFGDVKRSSFEVTDSVAVRNAWGTHDSTGMVRLSFAIAEGAQLFLRRHGGRFAHTFHPGTGTTATSYDATHGGDFTCEEMRGMKTFLHEEIHGASLINSQKLYHGAGAIFEEATTELAARKTLKEAFKLSNVEWSKVCNKGLREDEKRVGSYESEIEYVWAGVSDAFDALGIQAPGQISDLGAQWWNDFTGAAAIAMRRDDGRALFVNDLSEAVRRFVMALPIPDATWKGIAGKGKNPAQASDVEALFKDKATERILFWMNHENETMRMLGTNWPPQKTEAKELNLSPYSLKRNDLVGAIHLAVRLQALKKLTPEVIQVLLHLQDNQKPLLKALEKVIP